MQTLRVCVLVCKMSELGDGILEKEKKNKPKQISAVTFHLLCSHLRMVAPVVLTTTQRAPPTVHQVGTLSKKTI